MLGITNIIFIIIHLYKKKKRIILITLGNLIFEIDRNVLTFQLDEDSDTISILASVPCVILVFSYQNQY